MSPTTTVTSQLPTLLSMEDLTAPDMGNPILTSEAGRLHESSKCELQSQPCCNQCSVGFNLNVLFASKLTRK